MTKNQYQLLQTKQLPRGKLLEWLLKLSLKRFNNKLILFFDNLESVQNLTTPHTINNPEVQLWLDAALAVSTSGLKVLATSRWLLPDWATELHCALGRPVYGDYVAFARQQALPLTGERLQKAYQVLGGNFRALEYFAKAAKTMDVAEEDAFLVALGKAEAEAQTDMALAKLLEHCSTKALSLLLALRAYPVAVPLDGVKKLGYLSKLENTQGLLDELVSVSLVEQYQTERGVEYQLAPLVSSYLNQHHEPIMQELLQAAAKFLYWQLEERVNTNWEYKLATHGALTTAGLESEAHRLALDWIVGMLSRAGLYTVLLEQWLPPICESSDAKIKAKALNQTGLQNDYLGNYSTALNYYERSLAITQDIGDKAGEGVTLNNLSQIFQARGDYDTALDYLQRSLAIQQEIGDKAGEGATLNNLSHIFKARGDYDTALDYLQRSLAIRQEIGDMSGLCGTTINIGHIQWQNRQQQEALLSWVKGYQIAKKIGFAQALQALESMGKQLGSDEGLALWEQLAQQMENAPAS